MISHVRRHLRPDDHLLCVLRGLGLSDPHGGMFIDVYIVSPLLPFAHLGRGALLVRADCEQPPGPPLPRTLYSVRYDEFDAQLFGFLLVRHTLLLLMAGLPGAMLSISYKTYQKTPDLVTPHSPLIFRRVRLVWGTQLLGRDLFAYSVPLVSQGLFGSLSLEGDCGHLKFHGKRADGLGGATMEMDWIARDELC